MLERSLLSRSGSALAFWLVLAGGQIALAFAAGGTDSDGEPLYSYGLAVGGLILYGILFALTFWIASLYPQRRAALGLHAFPARALWLALGVVVASLVVSFALEPVLHAGREQGLEPERWRPDRATPFILNAAVIVTVVPFAEELFFRGLGVRVLRIFGSAAAVAGSAIIFAFAHGLLVALPALGFFGLALGWLRLRTDSVWPGIIAHATYNALGIAAFFATSSS